VICFNGNFTSIYVIYCNFIHLLRVYNLLLSVGKEDPGHMLTLLWLYLRLGAWWCSYIVDKYLEGK